MILLTRYPIHATNFDVKFLKVLTNSLISGIFFSFLLALLLMDLNINLNFKPIFFGKLTLFISITYGLLISLLCTLVFFTIQFISGKEIKISFVSHSFLILSFSFLLLLFLVIFKANYNFFISFFAPKTQGLLKAQSLTLLFMAILGFIVIYSFHFYRKKPLYIEIYFLLLTASIIFVCLQRMNYPTLGKPEKAGYLEAKKTDKKITIIGLDGLSFDFIIPLINDRKLPNFAWLMEEGSWGKLENLTPGSQIALDTSFNTGKFPAKHRQLSLHQYSLLRFNINIEVIPRFIFFWHMKKIGLLQILPNQRPLLIKDIWKIFEDNKTTFLKKDKPFLFSKQSPSPKAETLFNFFYKDLKFETSHIFRIAKQAFFSDVEFEDYVSQEKNQTQPQLVYFLLDGLNIVQTYFYKYSFPDLFGNLDQEKLNKYGLVIEKYYQLYDQIIGKYLTSLKEDELLIVYSSHGIEPLPLWKRFVEGISGDPYISAYHDNAPEGVVFFYGKEISRGKNIEGMKLVDIAPTLLNYIGLPVGKDMDGIVSSSIFKESYKIENPVLYISSYEEIDIK